MNIYTSKKQPLLVSLLWAAFFMQGSTLYAQDLESFEAYDCVITPSAIVNVSSTDAGVLENVLVDRSDKVKKGQVIAQLESDVEEVDLDIAKAQADIDAVIKLREVSLQYDNQRLNRIKSLRAQKMISAQDTDKAKREAELAKWRLEDAKDLQLQRKLKLKRAQAVLKRRSIHSPIDGVVVQRLRHPGEYVEEDPIARIAKLDPLYVEVILPIAKFGQIQSGQVGFVVPELTPENQLEAKVHVVDEMGDAASGTFGVRLTLPNPNQKISAGMKCQIQFQSPNEGG